MTDISIYTGTGRLTKDPELKATTGGSSVLEFSLAYNTLKKGGSGYEDKANYLDCTIFGNRANALSDILRKGMRVTVSGTLEQQRWERDGEKRSKHVLYVREVILPSKGETQPQNGLQSLADASESVSYADIPF